MNIQMISQITSLVEHLNRLKKESVEIKVFMDQGVAVNE